MPLWRYDAFWFNDALGDRRPRLAAKRGWPLPAAATNPAKGQVAPPPLGHLPHGLPAVLSLDGAANPAISISKITCYSPFTGYLACNFGIWDSFFRIYLHFYQKGQCLVKMKVFFYKNVSQFRKSLETVPLPNTGLFSLVLVQIAINDTIVHVAGSRVERRIERPW